MNKNSPTAALIIIGNEILSGRTQDANLNFLAKELNNLGIRFKEARVIPDIKDIIIQTIQEITKKYDYIFTTGGIGPTHDDITTDSVAAAFGKKVVQNAEAKERLEKFYLSKGEELNAGRLKMATVPEGAVLIDNPISFAPGYRIENVYVMAGIPKIMQAMFEFLKPNLQRGEVVHSKEYKIMSSESKIADALTKLQDDYPDVEIGSYPFKEEGEYGVNIVFRSKDSKLIDVVLNKFVAIYNA